MSTISSASLGGTDRGTPLVETGFATAVHSTLSMGFGDNFVEITALTTLLGSTAAESLILGNQGPAGLAWATMSSFGLMWVIRSCLAAAIPAWLREMISIRTKMTDMAIGMELAADSGWASKVRNIDLHPVGIVVDAEKSNYSKSKSRRKNSGRAFGRWADVYAFDRSISKLLSGIPDNKNTDMLSVSSYSESLSKFRHHPSFETLTDDKAPLRSPTSKGPPAIHTYAPYTFYRMHNIYFQVTTLLLAAFKFSECLVLWKIGAGFLSVITMIPWVFFFIAALLFEVHFLMFLRHPVDPYGPIDILAGGPPTMTKPGGPRKIFIGASRNLRHSPWWRAMWGLGALISVGSLILVYMVVGNQSNKVVFVWAGFQGFWMLGRLLVHHFAGYTDLQMDLRILVERPWMTLPRELKERVLALMAALAEYMTVVHPRQKLAYEEDIFRPAELKSILLKSKLMLSYPVPSFTDSVEIDVRGVIGDTTLHSAAWMTSSSLTSKELYDCCILSFDMPSTISLSDVNRVYIPAVRVFSGSPLPGYADAEISFPQFIPKGALNLSREGTWYYFIPSDSGDWILLCHAIKTKFVGRHSVRTMTDAQVTEMLAAGNLRISLSHVNEVWMTLGASRNAVENLLELLEEEE